MVSVEARRLPARLIERRGTPDDDPPSSFAEALLQGLTAPRKSIPSTFFYDARGSRLFDRICALPEYYLTRTELAMLRDFAPSIAERLPRHAVVIEPGGGSCTKVRLLLDALREPAAYVPLDVSADHLRASARTLAEAYPRLVVMPMVADFTEAVTLPETLPPGPRITFFPGSTIGNFDPPDAARLLERLHCRIGAAFCLVGVDLKKPREILEAAYNDASGVTDAFNRNLLVRANREAAATFDLTAFAHQATYNEELGRIEMYLISEKPQTVSVAGRSIVLAEGEVIHTENSYKYSVEEFQKLASAAGLISVRTWVDAGKLFAIHLFRTD